MHSIFRKLGIYCYRPACLLISGLLSCYTILSPCYAHVGDNHAPQKENHKNQSNSNLHVIRKTPNGLIVPHDIQSRLRIVTAPVAKQMIKGTKRLVGHVMSDPSGYAHLQATQNARVLNDPEYPLPVAGQKVKKNQVILALQPTLGKVESSEQRLLLYKAESEIVQLKKEVERKEKLGQFASEKERENAHAELERAVKQKEEIINITFKPEYLVSPLDGIVADLHVRPGEIVTPDKTIVEIVDPTKLLVEAFVFDPTIAGDMTGGIARLPLYPNKGVPLKLLGVSPKVNKDDQSIHIIFKVEEANPFIKLDMAVEVQADLKTDKPAIVIPKKAIVEDSKGSWVFIRTAPEVFELRKIRLGYAVGEWIGVEEGVSIGEQIVIEGAYLLKQAM